MTTFYFSALTLNVLNAIMQNKFKMVNGMKRYLSKENISTYKGNVVPLSLLGGISYSNDNIQWCVDDEKVVAITSFKDYHNGGGFTDGVLLTCLNTGNVTVTAKFMEEEYQCKVTVKDAVCATSFNNLNYYLGDMHDHTCDIHIVDDFSNRPSSLYPENYYLPTIDKDLKMDFALVSDHGCLLNGKDFYRGYADTDKVIKNTVIFPGAEGQVTIKEVDRYGIEKMNGGEVLMLNADTTIDTNSWDKFFDILKNSPFAFCGYPHPQIIGSSVKGIWNFKHSENNSDRFKNLFRFIEMGDGTNNHSNLINEYIYSVALDQGFKLSPTCSSDHHGPNWGYGVCPGKTVILANEKSKEAFYDAILNNRMYATSSGNVKLSFTVNGKIAPTTLNNEGEYNFNVKISYFENREDTKITCCKVISDGGITVLDLVNRGDDFDFTIISSQSHYYYLVLIDDMGRKTWSFPVWTGKPFENENKKELKPIPKTKIKVFDNVSKEIPAELINDNPLNPWYSKNQTAEIVFELNENTEISALSHYPMYVDNSILRNEKARSVDKLKMFPSLYQISVSEDGKNYSEVKKGVFRVYGGEEIVHFNAVNAKYVKLEILSTVGKESFVKEFLNAAVAIGEITFWN